MKYKILLFINSGIYHKILSKLFNMVRLLKPDNFKKLWKYNNTKVQTWSDTHEYLDFDLPYSTSSQICKQSFYDMPFFQYWSNKIKSPVVYHRKLWEFVFIAQALYERGLLVHGNRGLGFGVGKEPLVALFASMGCQILATDIHIDSNVAKLWKESSQHIKNNYLELNELQICPQDLFEQMVSFREVNMNHIPDDISGYDFNWSACCLEHLGSIENGLAFIKNQLKTLRPNGIAIHTMEYNLSSNDKTIENSNLSIFRKKDIQKIIKILESEGHKVAKMDWNKGSNVLDKFIDLPPHCNKNIHLKLDICGYECTSIGLIIRKKAK